MSSPLVSHTLEHDKGLVYPTVVCALSGVVVSEASRFVALCCRPCRTVIVDRDKLMVSYLLRIFSQRTIFVLCSRVALVTLRASCIN